MTCRPLAFSATAFRRVFRHRPTAAGIVAGVALALAILSARG